jgi:hypothetical protein
MTEGISEIELKWVEHLIAGGTPGPWLAFLEGREQPSGEGFIRTGKRDEQTDMYMTLDFGSHRTPALADDLEFIAVAKKEIPRLVGEIRRLRDQSAWLLRGDLLGETY